MSWYWKWNPTRRKDLITYSSHPWIMFSFNSLVIILRVGVRLKMNVQGFRHSWTRRGRGLDNRTIFMEVISVSSLIYRDAFRTQSRIFQIAKFVILTFLLPFSRRRICQKPKKIWRFQKEKTQVILFVLQEIKKSIKIEPFSYPGNQ